MHFTKTIKIIQLLLSIAPVLPMETQEMVLVFPSNMLTYFVKQ